MASTTTHPQVPKTLKFGEHEIVSVVFLGIYALLMPISVFLWVKFIKVGYPWKYGFYGATLLCACRIGCFVSELIYWNSKYQNVNAYIAYLVMLSVGYIGLIDCESALYLYWAERHFNISPLEQNITGKLRLLNLAGLIFIIIGSTKYDNFDNSPSERSQGLTFIRVSLFIFLGLTIFQALYLMLGWVRYRRFSKTLATLTLIMTALLCRIIFSVTQNFDQRVSVFGVTNASVKYLVGPFLIPEVFALVLMLTVGWTYVRSESFGRKKVSQSEMEMKAHQGRV